MVESAYAQPRAFPREPPSELRVGKAGDRRYRSSAIAQQAAPNGEMRVVPRRNVLRPHGTGAYFFIFYPFGRSNQYERTT